MTELNKSGKSTPRDDLESPSRLNNQPSKKSFGYYKASQSNTISPLRGTLKEDLQKSFQLGKLDLKNKELIKFRSDIEYSGRSDFKSSERGTTKPGAMRDFWKNKKYKHLNEALRKSREEIAVNIDEHKMPFFETKPIQFSSQ